MLFTDGLVETADRDIGEGIDRLTGEADRYVAAGFHGAAWHLIEAVAKDVNDDRALLLICRRGPDDPVGGAVLNRELPRTVSSPDERGPSS